MTNQETKQENSMPTKKKVTKSKDRYPKMFLDIETVGNPSAIALVDEPEAPKNLKDPEKIAAAIAEKKQEIEDHAGLDNDLGQIAAIGYAIGKSGDIVTNVVQKGNTERSVLKDFWFAFSEVNGRCAGYNILQFDLPFIMKRSFDLGIRPSIIPNLAKYRTEPVTDLYQLLCGWDYRGGKKLKWICKRYGIEVLAEDVDGSMVKDMTPDEIAAYLRSDIHITRELYYRMEGYYFI